MSLSSMFNLSVKDSLTFSFRVTGEKKHQVVSSEELRAEKFMMIKRVHDSFSVNQ